VENSYHPRGMQVLLTNPRGFCAGVHMAVDVVRQVVDLFPGRTIFVYHEIVHNRHVVARFKDRGVVFVDDLDDVPEGEIVVFSAHGVSPAVREYARRRGLKAIDATCPLVTKVHAEAVRYARQGYQILLIGHAEHQEVVGTRGEAPDAITVVERVEDIPRLTIRDPERLVYLTQTTLSTDDAAIIINALRLAFPTIKAPPSEDICYATTNRQHAVRALAPECDLILVVGSRNSSNSLRLTEIAANAGVPGYLLDDVSELKNEWFRPRRHGIAAAELTVLLTAGASAPEDLVAGICRELVRRFGAAIQTRDVFVEEVEFALPVALRRMMAERGIDPDERRIRISRPQVTAGEYGAVPITVSAPSARGGNP
jgi:4-hydroxy-3-methylbut-2-enyl diphosphate reductase